MLLALPTKISPSVMSATSIRDVEEKARDEVYLALNQLADKMADDDDERHQKAH